MLRTALLEQVDLQKRFQRYPLSSVFHAAIQNRSAARVLGLGIFKGWLGMWDASELLAVSGS